jgi:NTE family protein
MKNTKKVGLALGSGGVRGFALIGVMQALKENNIPIDFISGTSIGSFVAAHYSIFQDVELLKKDIVNNLKTKLPSVFDLGFKGGLVNGSKFEEVVNLVFKKRTFSETKIPLRIVATDLISGQAHIFSEGPLAISVQASCTVPVLFEPVTTKDGCFVDGGLSIPVPVNILKESGADVVIAVNLYHKNEFNYKQFNLVKVAMCSTRVALYNLSRASIQSADIVLSPDTSPFTTVSDFRKYLDDSVIEKMISVGYDEAMSHMAEIKKLLK